MPAVIDTLRREHANMAKLLRILDRHLEDFDAGGSPDYDLMLGIVEYLHDWSGDWHHPKEERVRFKLRRRDLPRRSLPVGFSGVIPDVPLIKRKVDHPFAAFFGPHVITNANHG